MLKSWIDIEKTVFSNIPMIFNISKKEFVKEFAGSKLGILWAIIRPVAMILVLWFVFSSFRIKPSGNVPYILWLIAGYIPWLFISDNISAGSGSVRNHAYLVKKVKFPVEILPTIRILVNFFTFLILIVFSVMIFTGYGLISRIHPLEILYYTFATWIFMTAAVRLLSAWVVMSIDIQHALSVVIQFLFWMTPVMWDGKQFANATVLGIHVVEILKINPLFYLVSGYRDGFLGLGVLHGDWLYHGYFWLFTIVLSVVATSVFTKLRPEFDDVL